MEYMLKLSPLGNIAPHNKESQSPQLIVAHVEESVVEDLQTEKLEQHRMLQN